MSHISLEDLSQMLLRQARRWHCRACATCVITEPMAAIRYHARHSRCEGIGGRTAEHCTPELDAESVSAWIEDDALFVWVWEPGEDSLRRRWVLPNPNPVQAEALLAYALLFSDRREAACERFRPTLTWLGIRMATSSYIESPRNR